MIAGLASSASSSAPNASVRRPTRSVPVAGGAQVAHPLRLAAWGDEVADAVDGEQVDDGRAQLARRAADDLEHP